MEAVKYNVVSNEQSGGKTLIHDAKRLLIRATNPFICCLLPYLFGSLWRMFYCSQMPTEWSLASALTLDLALASALTLALSLASALTNASASYSWNSSDEDPLRDL